LSKQCCEPLEDLEQVAYLGLIRAIERFNPQQGCAFSSFAVPYIRGEILHYLRDKGSLMRIPRRWQDLYNKGKKIRKQLSQSLGRQPQDREIAQVLGVSEQEWNECYLALQNRFLISLDANLSQVDDGCITFGETLPDPKCQTQQKIQEDRLQLQKAMNQLEGKTRAAIKSVFLWDLPRKEAAKQMGISPMTVTRHLNRGLEQLTGILSPQVACK
jgi:RNA polymerase sigma-B factor